MERWKGLQTSNSFLIFFCFFGVFRVFSRSSRVFSCGLGMSWSHSPHHIPWQNIPTSGTQGAEKNAHETSRMLSIESTLPRAAGAWNDTSEAILVEGLDMS